MSFPRHFTEIKARKEEPEQRIDIAGYVRVGEMNEANKAQTNGYFRLADTADEYINHFEYTFGKEPTMIPVYFPTGNLDIIRLHQYEAWKDKRNHGYGDGEMFMVWNAPQKEMQLCSKGSDLFLTVDPKMWKEHLTLRFKIPNFPAEGFFVLKTGGADTSIPNILRSMNYMNQALGGIDNLLFFLIVEMGKSKMPGSTRRFPVIKLRSAYTAEQILKIQAGFTGGKLKREDLTSYLQIQEFLDKEGEKLPKEVKPRKLKA